jgi:hypothetical protein
VPPWSTRPGAAEAAREQRGERGAHLAELREHQHLLAARPRSGRTAPAAEELGAVLRDILPVAAVVRGVVADLLEAHQEREDHPASADPVDRWRPRWASASTAACVERRLHAREAAVDLQLGLVGQVGDDAAVGLEPAQDVRADQARSGPSRRIASAEPPVTP